MPRVLHLLSQRPSRTGSGVTLDALVRHAAADGWSQHAVVGTPVNDPRPDVGGLPAARVSPVSFGEGGDLDFPLPGMSDVMPYPSVRFSALTDDMLERYRAVWRERIRRAVTAFRPDVIHSHHVWVMSSLVKEIAPAVPLVVHCHATGLRQRELCPGLAAPVAAGVARADRFLVLHRAHAAALVAALGIEPARVTVVGAGYRDDLFHARGRATANPPRVAYVGKYSAAKGVPSLLDAFERVAGRRESLELHVVGSGAGDEAEAIGDRIRALAPRVVAHGALPQPELAALLRTCSVCVLPSFYEGVPLVLVEARACGCRLVATALPGVLEALAPTLGDDLDLVEPPPLLGIDVPDPDALPDFAVRLAAALDAALDRPPPAPADLAPFTWSAVYDRVAAVWRDAAGR